MIVDTNPTARILHLHFGKEGGAERFFVSLCQGFSEQGVAQKFLIRPGRTWLPEVAALGEVKQVNYPRIWPFRHLLQSWVARQAKDWQADAVIAWMPKAATLLPRQPGPARLVRLGDYPRHIKHFAPADCIVTNTPDIPNRLTELGWTGAVRVISNFPRPYVAAENPPKMTLPEGSFKLCAAGRFVGLKGFDSLINAISMVDGVSLCLVGDGEERAALERLAADLGVMDRLMITGWVSNPTDWLARADLACITSTHETLGNVVLEAWQCGVPVISTPTPGPSWLIKDGETGILLDDFTPETLARGIERAKNDAALRARMVKAGAAKAAKSFSKQAIVSAYFDAIAAHQTPRRG